MQKRNDDSYKASAVKTLVRSKYRATLVSFPLVTVTAKNMEIIEIFSYGNRKITGPIFQWVKKFLKYVCMILIMPLYI